MSRTPATSADHPMGKPTAMLDTLRRMRGLRKLLVHEYGRVDDAILFETIRDRLGDVEAFTREVLAHLRTSSPGSAG